jgi:hypothetical protein
MRHFLAGGPAVAVAGLPSGVLPAPRPALLVAAAGGAQGGVPRPLGAGPRAVPIAAITPAAQEEDLPTVCALADDEAERVHAPPRAGRGGGQSPADMRRQGRAESTRPCGIWPEGPGWSRLRALTHQRPRQDCSTSGQRRSQPGGLPVSSFPVQNSALLGDQQHAPLPIGRQPPPPPPGSPQEPLLQQRSRSGTPPGRGPPAGAGIGGGPREASARSRCDDRPVHDRDLGLIWADTP